MVDIALVDVLLGDLTAESADLDAMVAGLTGTQWSTPTPAAGWDIRDTITHLHQTDVDALLALNDAEAFAGFIAEVIAAELDPDRPGHVEGTVAAGRATAPADLLRAWRAGRTRLVEALRAVPAGSRVPWFGPAMSVPSFITARLMETWAHGQDVADALAEVRIPSSRLRHVAEIGVRARPFAYARNHLRLPSEPVRVELAAPGGELWTWGPAGVADLVRGPALDFCLLVTQRRNRTDLALDVTGSRAQQWMSIAQAYAGPPGAGRAPLRSRASG